ncbi:methyl-accepting chemotaxis protein [Haloimpatiens sp. FM7330]|uniref:methyl-accepting chemotaxis protein n=1 Tax=Haloimpatiens sp. FM7330 TaxID=3298610 RepID=UPI003641ED30
MFTKEKLNSVRVKLGIVLVLIMVIPMIIIGTSSYFKSYNTLKEQSNKSITQLVGEINNTIDEFLLSISRKDEALSSNTLFKNFVEKEQNTGLKNNEGINNSIAALKQMLLHTVEKNPNIKAAYIGTKNKNMYSGKNQYIHNVDGKYDPTTSDWYKSALNNKGKTIWTRPYMDKNKENKKEILVITAAHTLQDENGEVYGVVAMDITLESLINKINSIKVGEKGKVYITNEKGEFVICPDKKNVGKPVSNSDILNNLSTKQNGKLEYTQNGDKEYMTFVTNTNTNWRIVGNFNYNELRELTKGIQYFTMLGIVIAIILSLIISKIVSNKLIGDNLERLDLIFYKSASGDLSNKMEVHSKDEFGRISKNFNKMLDGIKNILYEIKNNTSTLKTSSGELNQIGSETKKAVNEIAVTINEISQESLNQSNKTEKGNKIVEDLAENIEHISKEIESMKKKFDNAKQLNDDSLNTVKELTDKNDKMYNAEKNLNKNVIEVDDTSKKIESIISVINDISEQTSLLSLNASIEAARAGEAGKGFSVVAEEVRKLAEQSANSVKDIENLISDIRRKSQNAVNVINDNEEIFKEQHAAVENVRKAFNNIYKEIVSLASKVDNISNLNDNTLVKKDDMVNTMSNIQESTQQYAASTQQVSAAAEETLSNMESVDDFIKNLDEIIKILQEKVDKFKF